MYLYAFIIIAIIITAITFGYAFCQAQKSIDEQLTRMRTIHKRPCRREVQLAMNWFMSNWRFDNSKSTVPIIEHTMLWLTVLAQFHPELIPFDNILPSVFPKSVTNGVILSEACSRGIYLLEKYSFDKLFRRLQLGKISDSEFAELLLPLFLRVVAGDRTLLVEIKRNVMSISKLSTETKNVIIQCIRTLGIELSLPQIACKCC
jgi:hypothetical protein